LKPVYDKQGIVFHQAKAIGIFPEGTDIDNKPFVMIESTSKDNFEKIDKISYDYLINATGPKLNFAATPGLGPDEFTNSICTFGHADATAKKLQVCIDKMKNGQPQTFVIGTGHGTCTCQGAAFEYVFNLEFELQRHKVRDKARIIYLTNESELGDFGVGGLHLKNGGFIIQSRTFAESLFTERNVEWITGTHVNKIEVGTIFYENLAGEKHELAFDFSMLIPPFGGVGLKAFAKDEKEITQDLFAPSGFMKVDADYSKNKQEDFELWDAKDWPETYQTKYKNIFAIGIAFAPPHQISKPLKSKLGTVIAPAPPRTGMPSAIMGRAVAQSITDMIMNKTEVPNHGASMARLGAACVASAGANLFSGSAVSMTMFPIVLDFKKYPEFGRSLTYTTGEIGLAGHWIKKILHYAFIYKAKAKPFWWIIPE
ncbi:MAG: hypothetical protein WA160_14890, partial [Pseudobdellovibrio sp.]